MSRPTSDGATVTPIRVHSVDCDIDRIMAKIAASITPEQEARVLAQQEEERRQLEHRTWVAERRTLSDWGLPDKDIERLLGSQLEESDARAALAGSDAIVTVLSGPPGTGKTTAAAEWLRSIDEPHRWRRAGPPRFRHVRRLVRLNSYDDAAMEEVLNASRLVIDDLGVEYVDQKGAWLSLLDELINERYARMLPCVVTTNLPAEQFRERYGARLVDRLRESGAYIAVAGTSKRRRA